MTSSNRAGRFHANGYLGVIYITGGGTGFISELMEEPGASRSVIEARVPYAYAALGEVLGSEPRQACSQTTANAMAMAAFSRALHFESPTPFGLACTASLATDREKRGAHRAHIALQTIESTLSLTLTLEGTRAEEEAALINALWEVAGTLNGAAAPTSSIITNAPARWQPLTAGTTSAVCTDAHDARLLIPGSFNPMHDGHLHLLRTAEAHTGLKGALELSIANVDKPPLDYHAIHQRLEGISEMTNAPVWLTRLPTFLAKAHRFQNTTFAVGADTIIRVDEQRYYGNRYERNAAIDTLTELGTRFLVFGRLVAGRFVTLDDLSISDRLMRLCEGVAEDEFRHDVSSTQIRELEGEHKP